MEGSNNRKHLMSGPLISPQKQINDVLQRSYGIKLLYWPDLHWSGLELEQARWLRYGLVVLGSHGSGLINLVEDEGVRVLGPRPLVKG